MQQFLNGVIQQSTRHKLHSELIFVEWNPPPHNPPLVEVLSFPKENKFCSIRIIQVSNSIHDRFEHAQSLPLFQMIGKNVGIRRARGKFILATNIDVLFSDSLIRFIKRKIKSGFLYRVDRLDIPEQLPIVNSFPEILSFCEKSHFRINGKYGSFYKDKKRNALAIMQRVLKKLGFLKKRRSIVEKLGSLKKSCLKLLPKRIQKCPVCLGINILKILIRRLKRLGRSKGSKRPSFKFFRKLKKRINRLHTNACGDFTLMSAEDWKKLKGYPEWHYFSWHLDSVLLFQAKNHKIKEVDLPRKMSIYHIDHDSGYTPEKANELFKRLKEKHIPYLNNDDAQKIEDHLISSKDKITFNGENWGLADLDLEEILI